MNLIHRIPFILTLGFLGSGKTSFLENFLRKYSGKMAIGLIQNELGTAGVDARILQKNSKMEILEINGGSVFCVCRMDNFIPALSDYILKNSPDVLLMEASGISDPLSIGEIIHSPLLSEKMYYAGAVCLVDALHFTSLSKVNNRLSRQVQIADLILLNKTDLVSENQKDDLHALLQKMNPGAVIESTVLGDFSSDILQPGTLGRDHQVAEKPVIPASGPSGYTTAVIRSTISCKSDSFMEFLAFHRHSITRLKGFVQLDNKPFLVQLILDELNITPLEDYQGPTQFVAIGEKLDHREFSQSFRKYCKNP